MIAGDTDLVPSSALPLADRTVLLSMPEVDRRNAIEVLEAAGATVRVVGDVAGLRRAAALLGPAALVVADLRTGAGQLRAGLRELARQDAVVLLADDIPATARIMLLQHGADHVARSRVSHEVVAMLSTVLRRAGALAPVREARRAGNISVDLTERSAQVGGRLLRLTPTEFDLIAYFVANPGTVLGRERLRADVWGHDVGNLDTVTVYVRRLRRKLEPDPSAPVYLLTIWGVGYRLEPSPPA